MEGASLENLHLADLHRRAADLGVPGYRRLSRAELVEAIRGRGEAAEAKWPEAEAVTGVLDRLPQGYGFLRLAGLQAAEGDVYVSASQIRRCELRPGDEVTGPARSPRRGERHRALIRVDSVNGQDPEEARTDFEGLTPIPPHRRLLLEVDGGEPLVRAVDLIVPLAFGQRVLVLAEPRSGRTTLLRSLGATIAASGTRLIVLLADERPEEVTGWRRSLPEAEIVAAPADQEPAEQVRAAELAIGHAKRRAETGEDVVVLVDSLSRLALGYRDPARVKRLFGAGRELAEDGAGSLMVVATVLAADDAGEGVRAALATTENVLLRLDAGLAARGIRPSLRVADCRASGEEALRDADELEKVRRLRAELEAMDPAEAARRLGELVSSTTTNGELLAKL
jgi:transcription termination factor Rho